MAGAQATAKAVTESYTSAPHITVFREIDATRTMEYIQTLKKHPRYADVRISPLLVLSMAVTQAALNTRRHMRPGMANLHAAPSRQPRYCRSHPARSVSSNIKNAHQLSQLEMAEAIQELTQRAREQNPTGELTGGTITITNIGVLGLDTGTPS